MKLEVVCTAKSFKKDSETLEYVESIIELNGIPVKVKAVDSTGSKILLNYVKKGGEN